MSKITEYEAASTFDAEDVLLKDGENGTMIISVENAASEFKRLGGIDDDISGINQSVTQAMGTIASNIAGVETDYIASKDYAIGDLFIVNNVLYKATAAIAEEDVIDTEINCAVVNLGDEIGDIRSELANKANVDGAYEGLTAGNAEQLIGKVFTEDDAAYTFRTAGGSADIGDREYDEIVGGSIVWNQRSQTNRAQGTAFTFANYVIENGVARIWGAWHGARGSEFRLGDSNIPIPSGHVLFCDTGLTDDMLMCRIQGNNNASRNNNVIIKVQTTDSAVCDLLIRVNVDTDTEIDITFKPQLFDLTQMFGSEIADYIYNLEQTTPGAGVAWFRKYFPKDYYEYNAGELMHVNDLQSHDMVGFNAWDEEWEVGGLVNGVPSGTSASNQIRSKNFCQIMPNTLYYGTCGKTDGGNQNIFYLFIAYYDSEQNWISNAAINNVTFTTPSNAAYFKLCTNASTVVYGNVYNHDICINLSWSGWRDGEYEPYVKHSYPLDSSLTLRGIPKLSTDGKLYYDGDHYKSDGTVERRYGIVDLGTLSLRVNGTPAEGVYQYVVTVEGKAYGETNFFCGGFAVMTSTACYNNWTMAGRNNNNLVAFNIPYATINDAKAAMSGVYLVYELAEPTTEEAQPFQSPQIVDDFGTEEYVTSSIVPVGHITKYAPNLRDKLQHLPDLADSDGYYMISQTGHDMDLIRFRIPQAPTTDGVYTLKATVSGGTPTYTWVDENATETETETTEP